MERGGQSFFQRMTTAGKTAAVVVTLPVNAYIMVVAVATTEHAWLGWCALVALFLTIRFWLPLPQYTGHPPFKM